MSESAAFTGDLEMTTVRHYGIDFKINIDNISQICSPFPVHPFAFVFTILLKPSIITAVYIINSHQGGFQID